MTWPTACPGEEAILRLVEGRLPPSEREGLIEHVHICSRCSLLLATPELAASGAGSPSSGGVLVASFRAGENILMEPNDQYLCIVPAQRAAASGDKLFLPFEGDSTLALILSKALLLAADRKITDPTITRQIGGAPSA
jgi:hypothetical protein